MNYLVSVLLLLETFQTVYGARILLKSAQLGSHILEQVSLGEELVSRGHEVYIALGSRYPKKASIEKRGIKTLQYKFPDDVLYGVSEEFDKMVAELTFDKSEDKMGVSSKVASQIAFDDCAYMMADESFLESMKQLKFDLAIVEPFVIGPCNMLLPRYLGIPFVTNAGMFSPWRIRIPALPSFANMMYVWTDLDDITLTHRLSNLLSYVAIDAILASYAPDNHPLLERYAPEFKSWNNLLRQSELFLVGRDHHLGAPIPSMPNYISVAGLTTAKPKKLPKELEDVANESDGIILLSFGSAAYYFPEEVIVKFLEAFSKLNQTVFVKFFVPEGVKIPKNVKVSSWLPQNDILGHPKTKLFITHCGINGLHEALYNGVPMIGFPLFAEQHMNCHRVHKKGFGLEMNIQDFTSDQLFLNIQVVLNNPKYRLTIEKASEVFRDQPMNGRERGAFWVEHVIKHGGTHLRMLSMDLPLYQFLMLDVFFAIGVGVIAILLLLRSFLKFLCRKFTQTKLKKC